MPIDFGSEPVRMTCPSCEARMTTNISSKIPNSTHINACIMCFCFFPLAWLPYCVSKEIIEHRCSRCDAVLGSVIPQTSDCIICDWCYEGDSYDEVITYDGSHFVYNPDNYVCDQSYLHALDSNDLWTAGDDSGINEAAICFLG